MSPIKTRITFHITAEQKAGLEELKARDGIPEGEAVRRALDAFLDGKGIDVAKASQETARRRAGTRRKA